jgi:hypothetical protein
MISEVLCIEASAKLPMHLLTSSKQQQLPPARIEKLHAKYLAVGSPLQMVGFYNTTLNL